MQKLIAVVLLGCLIQGSLSACTDGQFTTPSGSDLANHGTCSSCWPVCQTCTSAAGCDKYISKVKGVDSTPAILCTGAAATGGVVGYNSGTDTCDNCMRGCALCAIDYNICYACDAGWDFDAAGLQCVRASLGLAAVVLALSVLILVIGIISCILACKLS